MINILQFIKTFRILIFYWCWIIYTDIFLSNIQFDNIEIVYNMHEDKRWKVPFLMPIRVKAPKLQSSFLGDLCPLYVKTNYEAPLFCWSWELQKVIFVRFLERGPFW